MDNYTHRLFVGKSDSEAEIIFNQIPDNIVGVKKVGLSSNTFMPVSLKLNVEMFSDEHLLKCMRNILPRTIKFTLLKPLSKSEVLL